MKTIPRWRQPPFICGNSRAQTISTTKRHPNTLDMIPHPILPRYIMRTVHHIARRSQRDKFQDESIIHPLLDWPGYFYSRLFIYVALVIYTWAMTAILSTRPLKSNSWVYSTETLHYLYFDKDETDFHRERKIYGSVRTIQTFIQVVTLPWISTVCASAAVIFTQNPKNSIGR